MKRPLFLLLVLSGLLWPCSVSAQSITSYPYKIYNQGAAQPLQSATFQSANVTCGQAKTAPPSGTVANPSVVRFDDPSDKTKDCVWTDPGNGILFSLPFGATVYESTIAGTNTVGTSPESARSNLFTRPGSVPTVLTGLRVGP